MGRRKSGTGKMGAGPIMATTRDDRRNKAKHTSATKSTRALVYVDTNILLDFYQSGHDRLGVFKELIERADRLVTTEQTLVEFERNRAQRLSALIEAFAKSVSVRPHTTSVIEALEEWKPLIQTRDMFHEKAAVIKARLESFLADPNTDPVYTKFLEVTKAADVKIVPTTDELITRAHRRKLLGNPPSSPDKHTIGDELIWESLLEGCGDDLIIVSRDNTFKAHEAILRKEYTNRTGKKLLEVSKSLTSALNFVGVGSTLIKEEEQNLQWPEDSYDELESPWDADARLALEAAYDGVSFDFKKKEMYVPSHDNYDHHGDGGTRVISSLAEFDEWASETAFSGYNESAPRDSGEWVFEFDESRWIEVAQSHFEEELTKLGWT